MIQLFIIDKKNLKNRANREEIIVFSIKLYLEGAIDRPGYLAIVVLF